MKPILLSKLRKTDWLTLGLVGQWEEKEEWIFEEKFEKYQDHFIIKREPKHLLI